MAQKSGQDFPVGGNYSDEMGGRTTTTARRLLGPDWSGLLQQHARWLRTVLLARSGELAAVDELTQELAVAVLKQPPVGVPSDRLPAWLYGAAVRIALLHRRTSGRRRRREQQWCVDRTETSLDTPDPLSWLIADEQQQLVRAALERLGPKDRELLLLKYTEGWSYHELAQHIGISHAAVETRLHRARARLRADLIARQVIEVTA